MPAKKKAATRKPARAVRVSSDEARFRRQADLRTLQEAEAIRSSASRMRAAKAEAAAQRKALDRVTKK